MAAAVAATSCGSDDHRADRAGSTTSSGDTASSAPATSTTPTSTSTTIDTASVLAGLPTCADLEPAQNAAWEYRTLPDWVPDGLPERFVLTDAETYGPPTTTGGPDEATHSVRWSLAEFDGDRVAATIEVLRGVTDPGGSAQPGFSEVSEERVLHSVRGRPGRIARRINRGDPVGEQVAEWTEDGDRWRATSTLGVDELAAALESFSLHGDELGDPTGRFEVLGRRRNDPTHPPDVNRLTSLTITERSGPGEPDLTLSVRIEERPAALEGLVHGQIQTGSRRIRLDDRTAIRSDPEHNDARTHLTTTLADGSLLSISWYEEGASYRSPDDGTVQRIDEALDQVVGSLRRRSRTDDGLIARLATRRDVDDDILPLCVER